jgi:ubiquitin C-terminal hydrolase
MIDDDDKQFKVNCLLRDMDAYFMGFQRDLVLSEEENGEKSRSKLLERKEEEEEDRGSKLVEGKEEDGGAIRERQLLQI